MSTITERLELLITSSAKGAVSGLKETEAASTALDTKAKGLAGALQNVGVSGNVAGGILKAGVAGGAIAAGAAITAFALHGVEKFASLTSEVRGLQRVMGGSAEDASRVAGALRLMGIDSEVAEKGFFQLEKRIGQGKDTLANWGIEVKRNADGSANMSETLVRLSEGYQALHAPEQRAAFLMENFGKSGAQIAPLLSKSREELEAFFRSAEQHHEVFSQEDLDKGREYQVAMRELHSAWEGLSIELGSQLIPKVTQFAIGLERVVSWSDHAAASTGHFLSVFDKIPHIGPTLGEFLGGSGPSGPDKSLGPDAERLAAQFAGLNNEGALAAFRALNAEFGASTRLVPAATAKLENFISVAQANPAAAQQIVDGLKRQGVETGVYERALDRVVAAKRADVAATDANSAANQFLTGTYSDQIKVLDELNNALLEGYSKTFAAMHADEAARDALDNLNSAYKDAIEGGASAAEASEAQARALTATEEAFVKAAAAAGANAEKDHEAEGAAAAHAAGVEAQKAELDKLTAGLAPDSPLRKFLQGYIDQLDSTPKAVETKATVDASQAYDELNELERHFVRIHQWDNVPVTVRAEIFTDIFGGVTPRAGGGPVVPGRAYMVNENTPNSELFVPSMPGYIYPSGSAVPGGSGVSIDARMSIASVSSNVDLERILDDRNAQLLLELRQLAA